MINFSFDRSRMKTIRQFWILTFILLNSFPRGRNQTTSIYTHKADVQQSLQGSYATIAIVDEANKEVTTAKVGDLVRIFVNATTVAVDAGFRGIGVATCGAYDGNPEGAGDYKYVVVLIQNGCNDPPSYYDPFRAARAEPGVAAPFYGMNATATTALSDFFKIFKFPAVEEVWFKCSLFFCFGDDDSRCEHSCPASSTRRRRDAPFQSAALETEELSAVVVHIRDGDNTQILNHNENRLFVASTSPRPCQVWEKHLTYATVVLSVVLGIVALVYAKNRNSTPGDSHNRVGASAAPVAAPDVGATESDGRLYGLVKNGDLKDETVKRRFALEVDLQTPIPSNPFQNHTRSSLTPSTPHIHDGFVRSHDHSAPTPPSLSNRNEIISPQLILDPLSFKTERRADGSSMSTSTMTTTETIFALSRLPDFSSQSLGESINIGSAAKKRKKKKKKKRTIASSQNHLENEEEIKESSTLSYQGQ